jgi:hypothetical protein
MAAHFAHFGEALRNYRETYQERIRKHNPDMPRIRITALALIDCMEKKGYSISSGAYSEIESGISIPKDPRAFVEAACKCLAIEEGSDEWRTLVQQLGYDIVAKKLGPEYASFVFPPSGSARPPATQPPAGEHDDAKRG